MQVKLPWHNFDGHRFQDLCGKLLVHELLGEVQPNGALGPDGGIDLWYKGSIGEFQGRWRFQFKFHNLATQAAVAALKSDIKKDLKLNCKDEDNIVYVTNVTLNPNQLQALKQIGIDTLQSDSAKPVIHIWDGAKLEGLLSKHPVLWKGFWGNEGLMFTPFADKFRDQLKPHPAGFFNFSNPAYGREDELQELWQFLEHNDDRICTVVAPGGYGKTRLCLDFFALLQEQCSPWHCYVVERGVFEANSFDKVLSGQDKLLLMVDDADKEPQIYPLMQIVRKEQHKGKVKVILTLRQSQIAKVEGQLSSHENLGIVIRLNPLGFEDAAKMVQPAIDAYLVRKYAREPHPLDPWAANWLEQEIVKAARGVPLVLAAYASLLAKYDVAKALFSAEDLKFSKIVWELIEQELGLAADKLGITKAQGEAAMQLIALVTPFSEKDFERLIHQLEITELRFKDLLQQLIQGGFIYKHDRNILWIKRAQDVEFQKLRKREEVEYEYALIPDPYKDIIVAKFLSETRYLQKLIKGKFGTLFYKQIFQNTLLSLDALSEINNDAVQIIHAFAEKIGRPATSIELVLQILTDVQLLRNKIPGMAEKTFMEILHILEAEQPKERLLQWKSIDNGKPLDQVITLTEEIFKQQVVDGKLSDQSYELLLRYGKALGSWRLFASLSKVDFVFGKGFNYHNADFLIQKAMDHLVLGGYDVKFGLQYLAWNIGAHQDETLKEIFPDRGYTLFGPLEDEKAIPAMRRRILEFMLGYAKQNPAFADIVWQICWSSIARMRYYWYGDTLSRYTSFVPDAREICQATATKEIMFVYKYLLESAQFRQQSVAYRDELWWQLHFLHQDFKLNDFALPYNKLYEIATKVNSVGEEVVFTFLHRNAHRHDNAYLIVPSLLGKVQSTGEAVATIVTYFAAIDEFPKDKTERLAPEASFLFWHLCKEAKINVEELYEALFRDHRGLLWQSRGSILEWIRFGDRPNRDFFLVKANELMDLDDPKGKLMLLQAYYGIDRMQAISTLIPHDLILIEAIFQFYLDAVASNQFSNVLREMASWFTSIIPHWFYYNNAWVEKMCRACYEAFPLNHGKSLFQALESIYQQDQKPIHFLQPWILEVCWAWDFASEYMHESELMQIAFEGLPTPEVFDFLEKHLQYRHQVAAKDEALDWTFLPMDPNARPPHTIKYVSAFPIHAFENALKWYHGLNFEADSIIPSDAWHLLRYFKPATMPPEVIQELFRKIFPAHLRDSADQFKRFTALLVFLQEHEVLIVEILLETGHPFPRLQELPAIQSVPPLESAARGMLRIASEHWKENCPHSNERAKALAKRINFDLRLWL